MQVVCWYSVWLRGAAGVGGQVSEKPSKHMYILTALSTTRFNKKLKQVLPYQPTSGKTWPTSSTVRVSVSMLENRTGSMQEQTWGKFHCTSLVGILCGCVVLVVLVMLVLLVLVVK